MYGVQGPARGFSPREHANVRVWQHGARSKRAAAPLPILHSGADVKIDLPGRVVLYGIAMN